MKIFWTIIIALMLVVGGAGWWFWHEIRQPAGSSVQPVTVTVTKGSGVRAVAESLYQRKLIRARWEWNLYIIVTGRRSSIVTGDFTLKQTMNVPDIAHILTDAGAVSNEVTVQIREGMTAKSVATLLAQRGVVPADQFLAAVATHDTRMLFPDQSFAFLAGRPAAAGLEGYLFPDTYRFFKNSSAATVLKKMLDTFGRKFTPAMVIEAQTAGRTPYDVVILASILEVELQTASDRAMAADIFLRRIKVGMPLNADTTIIYALGGNKTALSLDDLKVDSPYNTYTHAGLPPGPIDNPGLSSLTAALRPQANDNWYYLTAPGGKTIFSKTLAEHNKNKQLYLK